MRRRRRNSPKGGSHDEQEEMDEGDLEEEMTSLMKSIEPPTESTNLEYFINDHNSTSSRSAVQFIESLPDEALLHIFSYLTDIKDLLYVSCVTRRWRFIALSRICILTVLSNRLGHKIASDLVNKNGNDNDNNNNDNNNNKELRHVVALQKVYEAQCCWDKLELFSQVFELLSRPSFVDLYPGEALCTVDIIPPYDESARVVYENHGPTRNRKILQNELTNNYKIPIQDLVNPECEYSRPEEAELYENASYWLPAEVWMHYKLHNGIQLHLESYTPPKTYHKDGTGMTAVTDRLLYGFGAEKSEAVQAFPHYDFILYPANSAGLFRIHPHEWFLSVPKWFDDTKSPTFHIGLHGPRHYVAARPSGEVIICAHICEDPSRVQSRSWPEYLYHQLPLGNEELVGVYPSLTSYLQRSVCPEVEKGLINLTQKMIDIWNTKRRVSVGETLELTGLLSVQGDHSPLLIEKAKKKLSAGKTSVISNTLRSSSNKPVRMLLVGSHTPFPVRTYRDRYVKSANKPNK